MSRISKRTPFGTGRSLFKIIQHIEDKEKIPSYSTETFSRLKTWLILAKNACYCISQTPRMDKLQKKVPIGFYNLLKKHNYLNKLDRSIKSSKDTMCRFKHFNNWFDALETLKLIHILEKENKNNPL